MDESTIVVEPHPTYCWSKKGSKPIALFNYTRERFHMFGALGERSFYCKFSEKINQEIFIEFIKELKRKRGKVVLLVDNAKWHTGKKIKKFVESNKDDLKLMFFLPYTPELNPIETRWREIKKDIGEKLLYSKWEMENAAIKKIREKDFFTNKMFHYLCP